MVLPNSPMHVAFYMHDLAGGGVERMRLQLIAALQARGIVVSLVVGNKRGRLAAAVPADLPVIDLGCSRTLVEIPKLVEFLRNSKPDILVASLNHNNIAAMIARIVAGTSSHLIICQHNTLSEEKAQGWKYRLIPTFYRLLQWSTSAVVAVSRGVATDLTQTAGLPRHKISVIYNPVIVVKNCFNTNTAAHEWLKCQHIPTFLFIGRLTKQKNVPTLLRAMQLLVRRKAARLLVIGEGEDEPALRQEVAARGLETAVDFVGFQNDVRPWLQNAAALVVPSRYEGLGNVIVEALACGTQVIAADCPHGPAEILLEGALGTLVPVSDEFALAEAMEKIETIRVDSSRLKARAESFTAAACAASHIALFTRVLGTHHRQVRALGIALSPQSVENILDSIAEDRPAAGPKLIVTPNLDHVRLLRRPEFAAAYAFAWFACPDGFPVLLYARLLGLQSKRCVTGCDLFNRLFQRTRILGKRVALIVESASTAVQTQVWLGRLRFEIHPLIIVAPADFAKKKQEQGDISLQIKQFEPHILIITLGAPVSEEFVYRHRHVLPDCWCLCVGQALRVELGLTRRAPRRIRELGLEWLWRIGQEPRRLIKRYVGAALWFPIAVVGDLRDRS